MIYLMSGEAAEKNSQIKRQREQSKSPIGQTVKKRTTATAMTEMKTLGSMEIGQWTELIGNLLDKKLDEKLGNIFARLEILDALAKENAEIKQKLEAQVEVNRSLMRRMDFLEIQAKSCNLIFKGIHQKQGETPETAIKNICQNLLQVNVSGEITRVQILRKIKNDENNQVALVHFSSQSAVVKVLKNTRHLHGKQLVISRDMPLNVRQRADKLLLLRKILRSKLERTEKITIKYDSMYIANRRFNWCNTNGLTDDGVNYIEKTFKVAIAEDIKKILSEEQGNYARNKQSNAGSAEGRSA